MKPQDLILAGLFFIALIFVGCEDEDDSPPSPPQSTCDLVCFNGGLVNVDSCLCACLPGYSGDSCQVVDPVCELQCLNNGILETDSCSCDCPEGFLGDSCEIELTNTELLTAKHWVISAATIDPAIDIDSDGTPDTDLIPIIEPCTLDDFWDFNSDGTYTINAAEITCDPNDPPISSSGVWSWNSDETMLTYEINETTQERTIQSLTTSELVWESIQLNDGVTYTITQSFN